MYSLRCLGKCWSRRLGKRIAMLVLTYLLYRGLNQITFLFWLFFFLCSFRALYFRFTFLYPLPFKAFSYSGLAELKTCLLQELLVNLSSTESGRCLIISGGWFEEIWMYIKLSFGFLQGLYVLFVRLNVTSKKLNNFQVGLHFNFKTNFFEQFYYIFSNSIR